MLLRLIFELTYTYRHSMKTFIRLFFVLSIITILTPSCKKDDPIPEEEEETTPPDGGGETPSNFFMSFDLDGTSYQFEHGVADYQLTYSNSSSIDASSDTKEVSPGAGLVDLWNTDNDQVGIDFVNYWFSLSTYSEDNAAALATIFTEGSHPYVEEADGTTDGVRVGLNIADVAWNSGFGSQSSSANFNVTETTAIVNGLGEDERDVKGTFNCTVYNEGGSSKELTNGKFYLRFSAP